MLKSINDAPDELASAVREFWPAEEWDNAVSIAYLESAWDAFAVADTRRPDAPCGAVIDVRNGVPITAEYSIGWFQINACNLPPDWIPERLYNTRHNAGTAHLLWSESGWHPWYFSARRLGLI